MLRPDLEPLLRCPSCHGALGPSACLSCGRAYFRTGDQFRFVDTPITTADAEFQRETQNSLGLTGKLFNFGKSILSSEFQPVNHLHRFLAGASGIVVELGAGARRLRPDVINVDLFSAPNVDVVADISEIPLKDGIADHVILDSVVEHLADPIAVIHEALRVLKPGGQLFINCPFMLPYHGYPSHYQNYTRDGLVHLLRGFSTCEVRTTFGPMTAWVNMTAETFAVLVGGERGFAYVAAKGLALLPIFWLKYLDAFFVRADRSHRLAGMLCAVAIK